MVVTIFQGTTPIPAWGDCGKSEKESINQDSQSLTNNRTGQFQITRREH